MRILDLQYSISNQIIDVIKTTSLVLPSFISPLNSFLFILASFFVNFKLNSNNEIIIIKQYFSSKDISFLMLVIMLGLFLLNFINKEYFSIKAYHKYKIEELEIRNNLKLGVPAQNEFHIENEVSIFFENESNGTFFDVEALIYRNGEFIKSEIAEIEISKKNFNLIFIKGERFTLNKEEKSKTDFNKFIYSINNDEIEKLLMDKEHYNTLELINHNDTEFVAQGHNRIIQYLLTICVIFISLKIIFLYQPKKNLFKKFSYIFLLLIIVQILNSYLIFLFNSQYLYTLGFYMINILNLSLLMFLIYRTIR